MASLNKVFLIGNLTRDPEIRYLPSGAAVCEFGLAMNRRFTTSSGQDKDETCFVDIVVWGKQAESCSKYLHKGSCSFFEGRLQMDQWQDRETGKTRSKLKIIAERVQFLNTGSRSGGDPQYQERNDYGNSPSGSYNDNYANNAPSQPQYNSGPGSGYTPAAPMAPSAAPMAPPAPAVSANPASATVANNDVLQQQDPPQAAPPQMPEAFQDGAEDDIPF